jgi:hypothetical protein
MSQLATLPCSSGSLSLGHSCPTLGAERRLLEAALRLGHLGARFGAALSASVLDAHVFGCRHNLQVRDPVVCPVPVDVVDELGGVEHPTKVLSHHEPMLTNVPVRRRHRMAGHVTPNVPVYGVDVSAARPVRVLIARQGRAEVRPVLGRKRPARKRLRYFGPSLGAGAASLRHVSDPLMGRSTPSPYKTLRREVNRVALG